MTNPESSDDRRSFASRTPVNDNPDKVVYRRGFVTRHQVSGWRFVMRRIASGVALHDTRMLVDPLRTQTRAVLMGVLMLITALVGCFVFSLIRPNGSAANNPVLADRSTAALYVRVGDQLHPVLNLASARLIVGRPVNPTTVKSTELDKFPRGNLIGIPGAPERMVQNTAKDADWTVCDALSGAAGAAAGVTVIAGAPDSTGRGRRRWAQGRQCWSATPPAPGCCGTAAAAGSTWPTTPSRARWAWVATFPRRGRSPPGYSTRFPKAPPLSAPAIPDAGSPAGSACRCPHRSARWWKPMRLEGSVSQWPALLRGAARRPAADLAGAGRDTAQLKLLRPGAAATAGRRSDRQTAGVPRRWTTAATPIIGSAWSTRSTIRSPVRTGASRPARAPTR